jgi:phosphopantothenoylcysteine synthetase/decarboxylase
MTMRHLLVVPCGAAPAADVSTLITIAQKAGWSAAVTATPSAVPFLDSARIERMTGTPPRTGFETPDRGQTRTVRKADAIIIAPATYNSINKLAAGIADTYALTVVAELIGLAVPTVIVPFVNAALAIRHPYRNALQSLRAEGIRILGSDDQWEPHEPGTGGQQQQRFPWQQAFVLAAALADRAGVRGP